MQAEPISTSSTFEDPVTGKKIYYDGEWEIHEWPGGGVDSAAIYWQGRLVQPAASKEMAEIAKAALKSTPPVKGIYRYYRDESWTGTPRTSGPHEMKVTLLFESPEGAFGVDYKGERVGPFERRDFRPTAGATMSPIA